VRAPALLGAGGPRSLLPELNEPGKKLLHVVEAWLRKERDERQAAEAAAGAKPADSGAASVVPTRTPHMPSKHLAFFR